jgi:hypothetical protein
MITYLGEQIVIAPLDTPAAPTLHRLGPAGSTHYGYKVVAIHADGHSAASAEATIPDGQSVLTVAHAVDIFPPYVHGAVSYDVYRTTGGASQGKIGSVNALNQGVIQTNFLRDHGQGASEGSAPTTNTTGTLTTQTLTLAGDLVQTGADAKVGFFGATAVVKQSHIPAASGGVTVDAEVRATLAALLTALQTYGLLASS